MALSSSELQSKLMGAANILRGQIDSADYKNYILSMLFLKRLSDRFDEEVEDAIAANVPAYVAKSDRDEHEFFVPDDCKWDALLSGAMNLGERLNYASGKIEEFNSPKLDQILTSTNWYDESKLGSPANSDGIIRRMFNLFGDLNLRDDNLRSDDSSAPSTNVLGDAYEYLIREFADGAGKKGGEFYTPRSVVNLIVRVVKPSEGMRICDPTAGSAGMLIHTAEYVRRSGGNATNLKLEGQERNLGTLGIGKMNLLLHGLRDYRLVGGDIITDPQLLDRYGNLQSYDRVIANPPFSESDWGYEFAPSDPYARFTQFGVAPPRTRGDLAFLQHMLAITKRDGMVGVVMPLGILFRGGAEGTIRRGMLEGDLFEAIIGLTDNLFQNAAIPVAICVFNKSKPLERRGKVIFIDADQEGFYRAGRARNYLDDEHIERIVGAYDGFADIERFAHVADMSEIADNDYNLNISRYVDTSEPVDVMSVEDALFALRESENRRDEAAAKMDALLAEIGYARG